MSSRFFPRKWVFLSIATLLAASVISIGVFSARRQRPNQPKKAVLVLPPVVSHVRRLQIANINVKNAGSPDAVALIDILNTSNLPVMAVEISTTNGADSAAVNVDGLEDPDNPHVVIPPFETKTLEMSFGEMIPDAPLVVSAASFADGTEDGDKWSLDAMKGVRAHRKAMHNQKGGAKP